MWSMLDFVFLPYFVIAAFVYGTYNEHVGTGIVASLYAGVILIAYFIALKLFFLLVMFIQFIVWVILPLGDKLQHLTFEIILTLTKLFAIFLAEGVVTECVVSDRLNFLDPMTNPFVERFSGIIHIIFIVGVILDIYLLIKTGHRLFRH